LEGTCFDVNKPARIRGHEVTNCLLQDVGGVSEYYPPRSSGANESFKTYSFEVCAPRWKDYIPCLDNAGAIAKLRSSTRGEIWERHCPRRGAMCCLIAAPLHYKLPVRWPRSRSEVSLPWTPRTTIFRFSWFSGSSLFEFTLFVCLACV
jgi:hypothetical protein